MLTADLDLKLNSTC